MNPTTYSGNISPGKGSSLADGEDLGNRWFSFVLLLPVPGQASYLSGSCPPEAVADPIEL